MAETVKKSRIVSEDDLEESLMQEFNMRLKHCMGEEEEEKEADADAPNEPQTVASAAAEVKIDEQHYEEITTTILTSQPIENHYDVPSKLKADSAVYEEIPEVVQNGHGEAIYENVPETNHRNPILVLPDDKAGEDARRPADEAKTVKDRMLLSTDDNLSCLLFTQTVTSPMLTPSEENIDFLKGFAEKLESPPTSDGALEKPDASDEDDDDDGPIYENVAESRTYHDDVKSRCREFIDNEISCEVLSATLVNSKVEDCDGKVDFGQIDENSLEENIEIGDNSNIDDQNTTIDYKNTKIDYENTKIDYENTKIDENKIKIDEESKRIPDVCAEAEMHDRAEPDDEVESESTETETIESRSGDESADVGRPEPSAAPAEPERNGRDADSDVDEKLIDNPSRLVDALKTKYLSSANESKVVASEKGDLLELKTVDIMKQISKFERKSPANDDDGDSTEMSETTYVESTVTTETSSSSTMQDRSLKKKKSKKSRSHDKENISVSDTINSDINHKDQETNFYNVNVKNLKSSFNKFDALQKKNILHVRSTDSSKAQEKFNGSAAAAAVDTNCKACAKVVFQMEQVKAEGSVWHKNCFRCRECGKQLNVDTYQSNEGAVYCKPHFKSLFAPRVVEDEAPPCDKPDLGLEELQSLNVRERFQVFENYQDDTSSRSAVSAAETVNVKRSSSILSKLAKFQAKGMDVGVPIESLNGVPIEESSSETDHDDDDDGVDAGGDADGADDVDLIRAKRVQKEKPFHFTGMSDVKSKWEQQGEQNAAKDERREERKQEIQTIRSRLFMGKQGKMKEAYQQAVMESESGTNIKRPTTPPPAETCDTRSIKERFEKGEVFEEKVKKSEEEDMSVFESGISKKSRSLFLELDANSAKAPKVSPASPTPKQSDVRKAREAFMARQSTEDTVKSSEQLDDVKIETSDIQQRFKFFETYKEPEVERKRFAITPPREGQVKVKFKKNDLLI